MRRVGSREDKGLNGFGITELMDRRASLGKQVLDSEAMFMSELWVTSEEKVLYAFSTCGRKVRFQYEFTNKKG